MTSMKEDKKYGQNLSPMASIRVGKYKASE